jgi:hypothetical protein
MQKAFWWAKSCKTIIIKTERTGGGRANLRWILGKYMRMGSSVGISTGYELNGRGSSSNKVKVFLFSTTSTPALGLTQLPNQWVPTATSSEDEATGALNWPLTSIWYRGQEWWSYTSTLPYVSVDWCLIKHRDTFILPYIRGMCCEDKRTELAQNRAHWQCLVKAE